MEKGSNFGKQPGFGDGAPRIQPIGEIRIAPNGRVIMQGTPIRRSEPVPGTSARKHRNSGQRNK